MVLSSDLIKQFAKSTKDDTKKTTEATVYGTVIQQSSGTHVRLDGTELLTPVETTAEINNGERVAVLLKNHTAMVMGNVSNPSASTRTVSGIRADVDNNGNKIEAMNNTVSAIDNQVTAQGNNIALINNTIVSQGNTITAQGNKIEVINNTIDAHGSQISTMNDTIVSQGNNIELLGNTITAQGNDIKIYNSSFQITDGVVTGIKGINTDWITVGSLEASFADIENLKANKLSVTDANIKYANIEFTNIGKAAMENFYAKSGLIKNVVVGDQTITGELVGVTIRGDLIEGNTIVADKLVVKGANGLYYKLNTDGVTTEAEQTDYNSLSGTIIRAKSVAAEKIAVEDLVAFGATIGGFNITENSIYSGVKETVDNGTRGIYLDNTGQIGFGDSINYLKFYKDQNGNYKLAISAESMVLSSSSVNVADAINSAQSKADAAVIKTIEEFYLSSSPTALSDGSWSPAQPVWRDGMYIWRRNKVTYGSGLIEYTPSETGVCITGNTGAQGIQGLQGEKGEQGIQGPKGDTGAQGNTSYFHIKYSDVENPTSSSDMKETPSTYIGTYVDYTSTDSTNPSAYTWARFQGIQGPKGDQGIPGIGTDGKTSYLHIAYANSQDGSSGFSVSDSVGKLYIGQYTDFNSTDSTDYKKYSWTKIKGDTGSAGNGVASTEVTYQAGSSGTTAPTGTWYSSPPQTSASAPYMWTRTRLTYTNGSSSVSYSVGSTPEGIQVGGRNLWINSTKYRESTPYLLTASGTDNYIISFDGKYIYSTEPFKAGDIITVQGKSNLPWAKTHGGSSANNGTVGYWLYYGTLEQVKSGNYTSPAFISFDGVNTVFKKTLTIPSISGLNTIYIGFRFNSYSYNNVSITAKFWDIKLEKGNKATDWTPAPEDIDASISEVDAKFVNYSTTTQMQTAITAAKDSITQSVSAAYATKSSLETANSNITSLTSRVQTAESKLTKDGLTTIVGDYYTTASVVDSKINGIQVGGRNLATSTNQGVYGWNWNTQNSGTSTKEAVQENGIRCCKFTRTSTDVGGWSVIEYNNINRPKYEAGKTYTVSFEVKASVNTSFNCYLKLTSGLDWLEYTVSYVQPDASANTWTKCVFVLTLKDILPTSTGQVLYLDGMNSNAGVSYIFRNLMIEKGNKATDWTPAPEDVDSSISAVNTIATQTADKFNWLVKSGTSSTDFTLTDRTASLVANAINLQGLVTFSGLDSAAQRKITTAQSTADSAKTAAANAQSTANTANSTANTAKANAATAQSTADSAKTAAANAQSTANTANSTANTAKTNAANAQSTADTARNEIAALGKITVKRYYISANIASAAWFKLGTLVSTGDTSNTVITVYSGSGYNGRESQNSQAEIVIKDGWQSSQSATDSFGISVTRQNCENLKVKVMASSHNTCDVWVYFPWGYWDGMYTIVGSYSSWTHSGTCQSSEPSSGVSQSVGYRANAENAQASANLANTTLANWCYNNDKTYINGGKIYTGTITANKLSVTSLSAISANLGSITAGSINIGSGKFVVTSAGALTATGATITGNITATSGSFTGTVNANEGTIGNIKISGNKISYDSIDSSYGTLAKFEISKSQLSYGCMIVKGNSMQIGRDQRGQTFIDGNDTTRIYGDFLFQDYSNTMRRPVASVSGDGSRVGYMSSSVSNGVKIAAQWNVAGASLSIKTFTASSSDIRLKENIRPTEVNALSVINQMGLYQFDWKRDGYHQKIGFVADYLEQQDEHLAIGGGYDEDGNMDEKVVNDFYLMGYAIKGIQELDAKSTKVYSATKSLEARINSLQYQLQQAFDKIAKQEKQINLLTQ